MLGWSPDGAELIVQCGDVYNEGGIFWLDLFSKRSRQIGSSFVGGAVRQVDWAHRRLVMEKGAAIALPTPLVR